MQYVAFIETVIRNIDHADDDAAAFLMPSNDTHDSSVKYSDKPFFMISIAIIGESGCGNNDAAIL